MNDLLQITGAMKDAAKMRNYSNTSRAIFAGMSIGSVVESLVRGSAYTAGIAVGTAGLSGQMAKRLLVNPRFVNWMTTAAKTTKNNPKSISKELVRLATIAEAEPELRDAIRAYADGLVNMLEANPEQ